MGTWIRPEGIYNKKSYRYRCSECSGISYQASQNGICTYKFCPWCGCKMKIVKDEEQNCANCVYQMVCKELVDGEWKYFKVCTMMETEKNGYIMVIKDNDMCEGYCRKEDK